jgi:hypothetical protein
MLCTGCPEIIQWKIQFLNEVCLLPTSSSQLTQYSKKLCFRVSKSHMLKKQPSGAALPTLMALLSRRLENILDSAGLVVFLVLATLSRCAFY